LLSEAEQAFLPKKPKAIKTKPNGSAEVKSTMAKPEKKQAPKKKAA
jgi:hypothetical protein